jgi:hypothetical protein
MPNVGFEPTTKALERAMTVNVSDIAVALTGDHPTIVIYKCWAEGYISLLSLRIVFDILIQVNNNFVWTDYTVSHLRMWYS